MIYLAQIQDILEQKRELLLQFEGATQQMLFCQSEQLQELVEERQRLIGKIDSLDRKLEELYRQSEDGELVMAVVKGRRNAGELPENLKNVYQASNQIRAVLSRLQESDLQATMRLRVEQEKILKQIKSTNQGSNAKAARFYSAAGAKPAGGARLGKA